MSPVYIYFNTQGEASIYAARIYLSANQFDHQLHHVYNGITLHKRTAIFVWGPASVDRDFSKDETLSNTINHHDGLVTQYY